MKFSGSHMQRKKNRRQYHASHRRVRRPFSGELLEDRSLMNVDTGGTTVSYPFHNLYRSNDVNADGLVTNLDAFLCIRDLQTNGQRILYTGNTQYTLGAPEGEGPTLFFDVNGDNLLTNLDAVLIITELRAEGEGESAAVDLSFLNGTNATIADDTLLNVGDTFQLYVTVQDTRAALPPGLPPEADFGLAAAYLNVDFNFAAVDAIDADSTTAGVQLLNFKPLDILDPQFSQVAADQRGAVSNITGIISNAGSVKDFFDEALGPNPVTLWRASFEIDEAPELIGSAANPDSYALPSGSALTLDVLGNDNLWGILTFTSSPATNPAREVLTDWPTAVVDPNDIAYGNAALRVESGVTITDVTGPVPSGSVGIQGAPGNQTLLYTPVSGFSGTVTFNYTITGDGGGTSTATVTIVISNPPTANNDSYNINTDSEDNVLNVLDNDSTLPDAADVITISDITVQPTSGTVSISSDFLTLIYTPNTGFVGTDTLTYEITDGDGLTDTATVTLNVTIPVNEVRISAEAFVGGTPVNGIEANTPFDLVVYVEDIRPDAPNNDPDLRGVAAAYLDVFFNSTYFTYLTTPSSLFFDDLDVTFDPAFFTDPPLANVGPLTSNATGDINPNHSGLLDEVGSLQEFSLGQTEFPPAGSGRKILFTVRMQTNGVLTPSTVIDLDLADELGHEVSISETPHDVSPNQIVFEDLVLAIVTVSPNIPVANPDSYSVLEDGVLIVSATGNLSGDGNSQLPLDAFGVLNNDTDADAGTTLFARLEPSSGPTNGTLTFNQDGTFTYTPNPDFSGTDSFQYRAGDDFIRSNVATVSIVVVRVPEPPVAVADSYNLNSNQTLVVAPPGVRANDTNPEPGSTIVPMVVDGPDHGSLLNDNLNADGSFSYTPDTNFFGVDTFTYNLVNVTDGLTSNTVTVTLFVGIIPGSVSGVVYADVNANGILDKYATGANIERTLGGIAVRLSGTDALGASVTRTAVSAHDGTYSFGTVLPGNYSLTETHPKFMVDVSPNVLAVNLLSGENRQSVNFGEKGLTSEFDGPGNTFASTNARGIWVAFNAAGTQEWFAYAQGWAGYKAVSATLSPDLQFAILRVTDSLDNVHITSLNTVGNPLFRLLGTNSQGSVARFDGIFSDFTFVQQSSSLSGEGIGDDDYAAAVDAVFGEE